jgi:hypothetical protein
MHAILQQKRAYLVCVTIYLPGVRISPWLLRPKQLAGPFLQVSHPVYTYTVHIYKIYI